tara:strand:+ start:147 stop:935 length:789 start_codon:yes stop_codon:yes gene_type:complete
MVLLSKKYKYIFIHIPKTAGTTIKSSLPYDIKDSCFNNHNEDDEISNKLPRFLYDKNCFKNKKIRNLYHLTGKEILQIYPNINLNDYYIFTFVRNPYDRLYSTYLYTKYTVNRYFKLLVVAFVILFLIREKYPIFKYLLILFALYFHTIIFLTIDLYLYDFNDFTKKNLKEMVRLFPQAYMPQYKYIEGVNLNFIGKQENFDIDFNHIRNRFNIKKEIKTINISENFDTFYKYINKFTSETINLVNEYYKKDFEKFGYEMIN